MAIPNDTLQSSFLCHVSEITRKQLEVTPQLNSTLDKLAKVVAEAWPDLTLSIPEFFGRVAKTLPDDAPFEALQAMHAADLYLATACALGNEQAVALCDQHFFPSLAGPLARFQPSLPLDEALQTIRLHLFIPGKNRPAKIAEYAGRGELGAWLRVVAIRVAISILRRKNTIPTVGDQMLAMTQDDRDDPELEVLKQRYRGEFQAAFATAMGELNSRDKTILRLQYLDNLSIDKLGVMYNVHRATAARWTATIRDRLRDRTREVLVLRLSASEDEVASVMRLVRSQLDMSVRAFLEETAE